MCGGKCASNLRCLRFRQVLWVAKKEIDIAILSTGCGPTQWDQGAGPWMQRWHERAAPVISEARRQTYCICTR
jgi:hypothetical protein